MGTEIIGLTLILPRPECIPALKNCTAGGGVEAAGMPTGYVTLSVGSVQVLLALHATVTELTEEGKRVFLEKRSWKSKKFRDLGDFRTNGVEVIDRLQPAPVPLASMTVSGKL